MHWNHRVMNCPSENGGEDYIIFQEVFYDDDGNPDSYCDPFIGSDTVEGLQELVARLSKALEQPMLHEDMFKQGDTA